MLALVGLVYEAAQNPARWPEFLEAYARLLEAPMAAFHRHRFDQRTSELGMTFGISAPFRSSYHVQYSETNIFRDRGRHLYTQGRVLFDEEICSRDTLRKTLFYNEYLLPIGGVFSASGVIDRSSDEALVITALRSPRQQQWSDADLKVIQLLLPHITRGHEIEKRLRLLAAGIGALDDLDVGVVFVRGSADVVYANRTAEEIFTKGDGLTIRDGHVHATESSEDAGLRQAIRNATAAAPSAICPTALPIPRPSLRAAYQVVTTPLVQSLPALMGMPSPNAMMIIIDPEERRAISPTVLESLYGLTPREAELASLVSTGAAVQMAAGDLGMSYETARSHLRRVFEKTCTSRQGELVALLARLPAARVSLNG